MVSVAGYQAAQVSITGESSILAPKGGRRNEISSDWYELTAESTSLQEGSSRGRHFVTVSEGNSLGDVSTGGRGTGASTSSSSTCWGNKNASLRGSAVGGVPNVARRCGQGGFGSRSGRAGVGVSFSSSRRGQIIIRSLVMRIRSGRRRRAGTSHRSSSSTIDKLAIKKSVSSVPLGFGTRVVELRVSK